MNDRCSACNGMKQVYFNVQTATEDIKWKDMWVSEFELFRDEIDNRMGAIEVAKVVCLRCGILFDGSGLV